jgi:hypothetical protein
LNQQAGSNKQAGGYPNGNNKLFDSDFQLLATSASRAGLSMRSGMQESS